MTGCATQRRQLPRSSTCALTWNFAGSIDKRVRAAVAAEREAVLELIESERADGHLYVEVAGVNGLQLRRMEYNHTDRQYYSADGYPLRDGLRVAIGQ